MVIHRVIGSCTSAADQIIQEKYLPTANICTKILSSLYILVRFILVK